MLAILSPPSPQFYRVLDLPNQIRSSDNERFLPTIDTNSSDQKKSSQISLSMAQTGCRFLIH